MRRVWIAAWLVAVAATAAWAQMPWQSGPWKAKTDASYTGPGDIVASATAWYGLRAYSAAVAATGASQHVVDLRRASDNATCTANLDASSTGTLDLTVGTPCGGSTVTAWTNNASSCTGSIATTTLTVASCTVGNLAVGLPITDANITVGTYITALGTGTGGAGTYTVNISQTAASAVFTAPAYAYVSKVYDQSGNGNNVAQATAANQPLLLLTGGANGPALSFVAAASHNLKTAGNVALTQPDSLSFVGYRPSTDSQNGVFFSDDNGTTYQEARYVAGVDNFDIYAGSFTTDIAWTHAAWHATQAVYNGSSSVINYDGTDHTGLSAGAGNVNYTLYVGQNSGASTTRLSGFIEELGVWPSGFSAGNRTSMCHNQYSYWGTATSC